MEKVEVKPEQEHKIPDIDQVICLHDRVVEMTGGSPGIRDKGAIGAAWGRAFASQFYIEGSGPVEFAAVFAVSIVKAHGFVDGNKRAAFGAMNLTLQMHGLRITASPEQTVSAIVDAASSNGDVEPLISWLKGNHEPEPVYQALFDYDAAGPEKP